MKIIALEDKVIQSYRNLLEEITSELSYKDLSANFVRYRRADKSLVNVGFALLAIGCMLSVILRTMHCRTLVVAILPALLILGVICFISALFKREYIYFYEKNGRVSFVIAMDKSDFPQNKEMVDYIVSKIQEADRT